MAWQISGAHDPSDFGADAWITKWHRKRAQFLAHATNAFEVHQLTRKEARLEQENTRLKTLVGELLLE